MLAVLVAAGCASPTSPSGTGPQVNGVQPPNGAQGATVDVTLTGMDFTVGDTAAVVITGSGITVSDVRVQSATTAAATLTIAADASLGSRAVTLTTATGGTSPAMTFTVVPPAPTLTAINPTTAVAGNTVTLTLAGTNFISNATTVAVSGSGVTVGSVSVQKSTSLTVSLTIDSSADAGAHSVTVKTAGGTTSAQTLTINAPPGPTIGAFTASPATITSGQSSTLSWTGIGNAASCSINSGVGAVSCNNASATVNPTTSTTYTLTANGAGGSTTRTATVTVSGTPAPPASPTTPTSPTPAAGPTIGSFGASPASITTGQSSTLSWSGISNATTCAIDQGVGTVDCGGATKSVSPTATTTYTLTATGAGGTVRATASVAVGAAPPPPMPDIGSFEASPSTVTSGQSSTLSWSGITNATSCSIDHGVGSVTCSGGSTSVSPSSTRTYTLTATGTGGSTTARATITVTAPASPAIGSFSANPTSISSGQSSTLSWSGITNATSCSIDNGVGSVSCAGGSKSVSPAATTTYKLTATGTGGSTSATASVSAAAPAIGSFAASPTGITSGQSSTLSWSGITNATTCSIDNGVGTVACAGGSKSVSPAATTSYTLTATGSGGTATATATVTVTTAAPAIGSFTANPTSISGPQTSTLSWSGITNATTCSIDNGVGTVACTGGTSSVHPAATTTYTLTATGAGGTATATATVTVTAPPPPMFAFAADRTSALRAELPQVMIEVLVDQAPPLLPRQATEEAVGHSLGGR